MEREKTTGTTEGNVVEANPDPWVAAFEALEQKGEEAPTSDADAGNAETGDAGEDADGADGQGSPQVEDGNGVADEDAAGGLDTAVGTGAGKSGNAFESMFGITEEGIGEYEQNISESIRQQTISEVANEFIKQNVRNHDGKLGATLDDDDICKRDEDGVPHFYNPETGLEFSGDNPRRQAQEWVDDYNRELARVFNNECMKYEKNLRKEIEPSLAVMRFVPKYEKLDDIRRGMLDNILDGRELKDGNGDVIGYSIDLDKALEVVEKQIETIQAYAKNLSSNAQEKEKPSGPALDMKTSSGAVQAGSGKAPKSLEEAMELLQDEQLSKLKG